MSPASTAAMPPISKARFADLSLVRVTGVLTADADLAQTTGAQPHSLLTLLLQPPCGLPYLARVDLGCDITDHMAAEAELPRLRKGALVSVAGDALDLRTDHGHAVLKLRGARALVIPITD